MPEAEIEVMDQVNKMNPYLDENTFTHKQEQKDIEGRIENLFGKGKEEDKSEMKKDSAEGYESISEENTTDTTDEESEEKKRKVDGL